MSKGKTYKFFGSEFKAGTALATAQNITAATNASPCVITVVGHGITTHGAVKVENVGGMLELNNRNFVVERVAADTLRLVGVDSTNFGAYTSGGTIKLVTMTAHCEQTTYSFDSGSTPVTEDETNCGVITNVGAPRNGSVSMGFKTAQNAFQTALEASQAASSEMVFMIQPDGFTQASYDIGFVTQITDSGSAGGTWDGTAAVSLTQRRVKVTA
jgi:hypothetical protein